MSFDRMDNLSGGLPGNLPRRSLVTPLQFEGTQSAALSRDDDSDTDEVLLDIAAGRGALVDDGPAGKSLTEQWADKSAVWSGREFAANVVNHATRADSSAGKALSQAQKRLYEKLNINVDQAASLEVKPPPKNYSDLFHLGRDQIPVGEVSWSKYTQAVNNNLKPFKDAIQSKNVGHFFKNVTPKGYLKETVVESNIRPIKDLVTNSPNKQIGTGVFQTAAIGLMGYDVVKHGYDAYQNAKAKEDGSFKSKLNTYKETAVALGKYTFRDGATWEAAGVGAAIGRAVLPLALGPVSLGGIAVGALVGLAAQKGLDYAMKTGDKDPAEKETALRKQKAEQEKSQKVLVNSHSSKSNSEQVQQNPFRVQPA
jgi:hypothetical protein